LWYYRIFGL